jgi:hypothetical protein
MTKITDPLTGINIGLTKAEMRDYLISQGYRSIDINKVFPTRVWSKAVYTLFKPPTLVRITDRTCFTKAELHALAEAGTRVEDKIDLYDCRKTNEGGWNKKGERKILKHKVWDTVSKFGFEPLRYFVINDRKLFHIKPSIEIDIDTFLAKK